MTAYLRLDVDPGATVYNTIPLKQAFGIVERSDRTVHATIRLDPARFVHPIEVAWSGRRGDVMTGNVSFRNHDLVMSAAAFARLEGARIAPHLDVPVHCVKTTEWGIRRLGVPVAHRWIAWAEDWETTDRIDWQRSTFIVREERVLEGDTWVPRSTVTRSFSDADALTAELSAAFDRKADVDVVDLCWKGEPLDLFCLPRLRGIHFVSEALGAALMRAPRLKGYRLLRDDGTELEPPRSRKR
jgi:hypothetical protein